MHDHSIWTEKSNCYAYILNRPDVGWINPGWVSRIFNNNAELTCTRLINCHLHVFDNKVQKSHGDILGYADKFKELFIEDGCKYLGSDYIPVQKDNVMFLVMLESGGYHCFRHDGGGQWSSKNGAGEVMKEDIAPNQTIEDVLRDVPQIVHMVGYFRIPKVTGQLDTSRQFALDLLRESSHLTCHNAYFKNQANCRR